MNIRTILTAGAALAVAVGVVAGLPARAVGPVDTGTLIGVLAAEHDHAASAGMATLPGENDASGPSIAVYPAARYSLDGTADLDGDGRADLLTIAGTNEISWLDNSKGVPSHSTAVTVRRGIDGRAVWSRSVPLFIGALTARVGTNGRPGVVVVNAVAKSIGTSAQENASQVTIHVTAYDGRTGSTVWSWSQTGDVVGVGNNAYWHNIAFPALPLRTYTPGASRLLVGVYDTGEGQHVQQVLVNLGVGKASSFGARMSGDWRRVGDVDGDGRDDIGLLSGSELQAHSSVTNALLWHAVSGWDVVTVPHTNGDHRVDIVTSSCTHVVDSEEPYCDQATFTSLDGRTGKTRWQHTTGGAYDGLMQPDGDVNGDGVQELELVDDSACAGNNICVAFRDGATGRVLWKHVLSCNEWYSPAADVGDLQADGAHDLLAAKCSRQLAILNGRTGVVSYEPDSGYRLALHGAVDGHGDDLLRAPTPLYDTTRTLDLTTVDGATGLPIWRYQQPQPAPVSVADVFARDLTGDGRADVVVDVWRDASHHLIEVLDGASGARRWQAAVAVPSS